MYQNNISDLNPLESNRYENIFNVDQTDANNYYFYNIIKTVHINAKDLDPAFYFKHTVDRSTPFTSLSYRLYDSINLWWLICILNNINNPVEFIEPGTVLYIIKKQYLSTVLNEIKKQLQ